MCLWGLCKKNTYCLILPERSFTIHAFLSYSLWSETTSHLKPLGESGSLQLIYRCHLTSVGILIIEIRRHKTVLSLFGPYPRRKGLYIESTKRWFLYWFGDMVFLELPLYLTATGSRGLSGYITTIVDNMECRLGEEGFMWEEKKYRIYIFPIKWSTFLVHNPCLPICWSPVWIVRHKTDYARLIYVWDLWWFNLGKKSQHLFGDVITHPCPNFNGLAHQLKLATSTSNLGHVCVITSGNHSALHWRQRRFS